MRDCDTCCSGKKKNKKKKNDDDAATEFEFQNARLKQFIKACNCPYRDAYSPSYADINVKHDVLRIDASIRRLTILKLMFFLHKLCIIWHTSSLAPMILNEWIESWILNPDHDSHIMAVTYTCLTVSFALVHVDSARERSNLLLLLLFWVIHASDAILGYYSGAMRQYAQW